MSLSPENQRILAIDVGMGTQDILLYDRRGASFKKIPENSLKMVLPSRTQILAKRVIKGSGDLFFYGETMGGGPLARAISHRIEKGDPVMMTKSAAMTLRDDLREVEAMGVKIIDEPQNSQCEKIETADIDFDMIKSVFLEVGEEFDFDCIGVAVQDHGHEPGKSDRIFRFENIKKVVKKGATLKDFMYVKPPLHYRRMNGALGTVKKAFSGKSFVVDTKIAAVSGALFGIKERPLLSIDVGNGHTMAAMIGEDDLILGMVEHHTDMLTRESLGYLIERFTEGKLTNQEVYEDGGHGCYIRENAPVKRALVTGPKRGLLTGLRLKIEQASPMGDVMMAGPTGIVSMAIKASQ
ncbi:MAG: DUF1786 family protein [Candidatus Hydrothermarchaeaceae archaeon]